ncbi:MAG TPA: RluA family pseudouridine synthase [Methylomirabilota bacterium]|nr:RluA family pseudouridine synthase [Methylomirabilota bacterium]
MTILYQDNDLCVIDKPAGITVNRAETTKNEVTVQDWMEKQIKEQNILFTPEQGEFFKRGGVVHRLDKETSGVLLLAKTPQAFENLQKQFKERTIKKVYMTLAHGKIEPKEGEIDVPVGRLPWNKKRFGILPGGRESKTSYRVLAYYQNPRDKEIFSYVEVYPQSGRTHQIRVHLKYIHHPIFSDFLYAGRKTARKDRKLLERVFLHAAKITLSHPTTGEMMSFESQLPPNLRELMALLTLSQ